MKKNKKNNKDKVWDVKTEVLTVSEMTERFKNYLTKEQQDKLNLLNKL